MKPTKHAILNLALSAAMLLLAAGIGAPGGASAASNSKGSENSNLPNTVLPGDIAQAPAAVNQEYPQIARGVNGYLVVWEDSRTNYNNLIDGAPQGGYEGTQLLKDIYAARLDPNGQLVDQSPIVVSQAIWNQTKPQVAWNGQNWLVVWNTQRLAGTTTTIDVMAARVSPDGVVLDDPAIVVDSDANINELSPMVASDGNNWLVTWRDGWDVGELRASRVSPGGVVLDTAGVAVVTAGFPDIPANPGIVFAGDEYVLVWQGNNKIRAQRISPALQPIGAVFQVAGAGNFPRIGTNGTDFLVTWKQGASVMVGRVTHDGQVLDPGGIDVSGSHGGDPRPQVVWDGAQWVVTWVATLGGTYAARVAADGTVRDPGGILVSASTRTSAIAARAAGGALLAWSDYHLDSVVSNDIFSIGISPDGVVGQATAVSANPPAQIRPDIVGNGTGYMAVFSSNVSGETRIKGQRLDATGNAIDAEPFLIMGGSKTLVRPRVAWNGTLYLVVWEDSSVNRGFVRGAIFGKRVSAQGVVLDATPFEIMGGNAPDVAALGSQFLVVDTYEQTNHISFPMAVRVDENGAVLGTPASIGHNYSQAPKVTALGNRWLAVWQRTATHDSTQVFIYGAFVNADGTSPGSFLVAGLNGFSVKVPDVAAGPDQALISYFNTAQDYQENGDVFGRRITADGTFLDGDPGIQITSAPQAQFVPSAAWTGSEYVVAYEDYRSVAFLDRPVSDVYATRVGSDGAVLDPNGFVVGAASVPEVNPTVASNGGDYLIGLAGFKHTAPYGTYRIEVQYGQTSAPMLVSHLTWQGRLAQPHPLQQLPVTLTLKQGANEYNYTGETDADGGFSVPIGNLPGGVYEWWAKGPKYLANSGTVVISNAPATQLEIGTMRAGDADDNNVVNVEDFNVLKNTFGQSVGDPRYDDRADFTGDQVVDVSDFNLLKINFGQAGAPPITP